MCCCSTAKPMLERISEVINPRAQAEDHCSRRFQTTGSSIGNVVEKFENLMPKSEQEVSVIKQRLTRAGYRNENRRSRFSTAARC